MIALMEEVLRDAKEKGYVHTRWIADKASPCLSALGYAGPSVTARKVRRSLSPAEPGVYCYQVSPCLTAAGFDRFYLRR
jgi:hypothetical protein